MANSKISGMKFNNIYISNKDGDINTYKLLEVDRPASPNMTYREFVVPKINGSKRYNNRYEDLIIKVVIGVSGKSIEKQTKITKLLSQWIGKEDKLIFNDRPNLFYKAKVFDSAVVENEGLFTKLTITFIASFCMFELYDDLRDYTVNQLIMPVNSIGILINRAQWTGITSSQTKQINNVGNYEAQPTFEIAGVAELLTITIADKAFSLVNINQTIWIDTENMIVYTINESEKVSVLNQFTGLFPTIPVGISDVYIGGRALNLAVTVDFKSTYIA